MFPVTQEEGGVLASAVSSYVHVHPFGLMTSEIDKDKPHCFRVIQLTSGDLFMCQDNNLIFFLFKNVQKTVGSYCDRFRLSFPPPLSVPQILGHDFSLSQVARLLLHRSASSQLTLVVQFLQFFVHISFCLCVVKKCLIFTFVAELVMSLLSWPLL